MASSRGAYVLCREDCTVDCGRCKGQPLNDLRRRVRRALGWGRDAHGGIPFDQKHIWQAGYDEARRAVLRELQPTVPSGDAAPSGGTS